MQAVLPLCAECVRLRLRPTRLVIEADRATYEAARGLVNGLLISAGMWVVIIAAGVLVWRLV